MISEIISISNLPFEDIFQIYIVQGFILTAFSFIAYKILKRGSSRINLIISFFYLSMVIGFFINFFFALILIDPLAWILYVIIMFFLYLGTIFLTVFTIMLKSLNDFNKRKQNVIILLYSILLFGMALIPGGLKLDRSTNWYPFYSDIFIFYLMVILSVSFVPALINSIQIYNSLKSTDLKKRWKNFIIGIILFFTFAYGTLIIYKITSGAIVLIWSVISIILLIASSVLIYYGIARNL